MPNPIFSVIIPVYNRWELTEACLRSLAQHTRMPFEILVVDNGSSDATATELVPLGQNLFRERFRTLRFTENRDFASGCNAGAAAATTPLLFFLNNDTLLTPAWAPPLLDALQRDPALGAVGPLLVYPHSGRIQHLGVAMSLQRLTHLYAQFPPEHPAVTRPRPLQAITAAAFLIPAALFAACGGFHPQYRNGFEDLELCLRIRQRGKRLACVPQSRVIHLESQTPGRNRYDVSNSRLFNERCGEGFHPDLHSHAALDGFIPFLSADLGMQLKLSPEQSEALNPLLAAPEKAYTALLAEPLWAQAYEPLLDFLHTHGHDAQALDLHLLEVEFFPSPASYLRLAKAATRARQPKLAEQAAGIMKTQAERAADSPRLLAQAKGLLAAAHKQGDAVLERLLQDWLAQRNNAAASQHG